jgi:hypothetical protein
MGGVSVPKNWPRCARRSILSTTSYDAQRTGSCLISRKKTTTTTQDCLPTKEQKFPYFQLIKPLKNFLSVSNAWGNLRDFKVESRNLTDIRYKTLSWLLHFLLNRAACHMVKRDIPKLGIFRDEKKLRNFCDFRYSKRCVLECNGVYFGC